MRVRPRKPKEDCSVLAFIKEVVQIVVVVTSRTYVLERFELCKMLLKMVT